MFATPTVELLANPFRVEQFDELTTTVANRLAQIFSAPHFSFEGVELEAKLGVFKYKDQTKVNFPELEAAFIPLVFRPNPPYNFVTEVPPRMFQHLRNVVMNGRVDNFTKHKYEPEIKYVYTHTIDDVYLLPDGTKVRVTRDAQTKDVLACITKEDLHGKSGCHVNVINNGYEPELKTSKEHPKPTHELDFRISAKREVTQEVPEQTSKFSSREKKRSSYHTGLWSIDMTEIPFVNTTTGQSGSTFEVEVEFLAQYMPIMKQAWDDHKQRANSNFLKIIRSLVTMVQSLIRFADPNMPLPALCKPEQLMGTAARKYRKFDQNQSSALVSLQRGALAGDIE